MSIERRKSAIIVEAQAAEDSDDGECDHGVDTAAQTPTFLPRVHATMRSYVDKD